MPVARPGRPVQKSADLSLSLRRPSRNDARKQQCKRPSPRVARQHRLVSSKDRREAINDVVEVADMLRDRQLAKVRVWVIQLPGAALVPVGHESAFFQLAVI